jgi:hypothetical protein
MMFRDTKTLQRVVAAEEVAFSGHPLVSAMHERTIEITTEPRLTPRGDCIIGVSASKGLSQLSQATKSALRSDSAKARMTIVTPAGGYSFDAWGSKGLSFDDPRDMVIRTSNFICGRTLAVRAASSARRIPRELVASLKSPDAVGVLRIEVCD